MRIGASVAGPLAGLTAICLLILPLPGDGEGATRPRAAPGPAAIAGEPVATFSIVGRDPETGDLGVAVQSRFFGVGAVVPWARAGVGAVATQSWANTTYGPRGLEMLADGHSAEEVVEMLTGPDEGASQRQLAVVGPTGDVASFTGDGCLPWAGGVTGEHYAAQGNILAGPQVVDAMAAAFETADGDLASRLMASLAAGQAAGGDARGRQSAALLVVREGGGYSGFDDRYIDLRVEDHPAPIRELRRLLDMKHGQQAAGRAATLLQEEEDAAAALQQAERAARLYPASGSVWLTLAAARLASGDRDGAGAAGRQALLRDPWMKTALLQGLIDRDELLEALLEVDAFARLWETLPARQD